MKGLYSCILLVLSSFTIFGQTITSAQSGNWDLTSTWTGGIIPTAANSTAIQINHNVIIPSPYTAVADQITVASGVTLQINAGGTLDLQNSGGTDLTLAEDFVNLFIGANLVVSGNFKNNSNSALNYGAGLSTTTFNAGGRYIHAVNGLSLPPVGTTWNATSTCEIQGVTNSVPGNLNQTFGNLTWNCSGHSGNLSLGLTTTVINGDLSILNTNAPGILTLASVNGIVDINRNFVVSGTSRFLGTASSTVTIDLEGNFSFSSTALNPSILISSLSTLNFNVGGNFTVSSGTLQARAVNTATTNIIFDGISAPPQPHQNYDISGGSLTENFNWRISNGSAVNMGTSAFISPTGTFILNAGGFMKVGSPDGLNTGTTLGNVRVGGARTYTANSNIIYNGTVGQNIGTEWSASGALNAVAVNLEIANTSSEGVTNNIIGSTSLVGNLTLTTGSLNIGNSNTLQIQSNFIRTSGTIGGDATSNLTFSGSGTLNTLSFKTGMEFVNNLTVSRIADLVLGSSLTISGTIDISGGNLDFSGQTLTMNGGSITSNATGLKSSSTSNLTFGGSTFTGSIPFSGTGNQLNTLTFSTNGGAYTWNSGVTVNTSVYLTAGTLTHTSGITMAANSTIFKGAGSITSSSPVAATSYNVTYSGTGNTGLELPTTATALNNLTITSSGTVTLAATGITVNGDLLISGGTFAAGANNFTMKGANWTISGGVFTPGTGTVSFSGTTAIGGTGTTSFNNLTTNSGSTLTMFSGNTNISGNVQLNTGGTFTANGGTITLNGSAAQSISAAGKTFNNISVNKSASNVTLTTALNLTGLLDIQSATTVASGDNLTLVSNASGTAMIGALLGGGTVSGNINAQRYIANAGRKYRDISSPVTNPSVSNIIASGVTITGPFTDSSYPCAGCTTNNPSFYYYDESIAGVQTQGYTAYPPSGASSTTTFINPGRGYNLLIRNELGSPTSTLTGLLNSGTIALPVTYTATSGGLAEDGWNFVGNPYPSPIDWDILAGWSKNNTQGNQISVYDPNKGTSGGYRVWNGSIGDLTNGRIASGQGFWVKFTGTPTLTVDEDAKSITSTTFYRQKKKDPDYIEIILASTESEDHAYIQQIDGGALSFDSKDGAKLMIREGLALSILTEDNVKVSIQAVGEVLTEASIPLHVNGLVPGNYKFRKNLFGAYQDAPVILFDAQANVYHDFINEYSFDVTEADVVSSGERFYLIIGRTSIITDVEESLSAILSIYPNPVSEFLYAKVKSPKMPGGEVLDGMGKVIGEISWSEEGNQIWKGSFEMKSQSSGIYFARVKLKNSLKVIKFVKR